MGLPEAEGDGETLSHYPKIRTFADGWVVYVKHWDQPILCLCLDSKWRIQSHCFLHEYLWPTKKSAEDALFFVKKVVDIEL